MTESKYYYQYETSNHVPIWVGKNARGNDYMTFNLAHSKDLWFHVSEIPGPHVILHSEGKPVIDEDIKEASEFALRHINIKDRKNYKVTYTQVINIEKNKYDKHGRVSVLI